MSDMFQPIDSAQEQAIIAAADKPRKKRGPDFSIRTATHWFTLQHHMAYCSVPSHYDNVPDEDYKGEKYDKYPVRMCVSIDPYEVCRWCYLAEADVVAAMDGLPPTKREDPNAASDG